MKTSYDHADIMPESAIRAADPEEGLTYLALASSAGGGSSAVVGSPSKIVVQTPKDGKLFASLALTTTDWRRGLVKGFYITDDAAFDCQAILKGAKFYSGWRSDGWQILIVPTAFLTAHVQYVAKDFEALDSHVSRVEDTVSERRPTDDASFDFSMLIRELHTCNMELLRLERRAHFHNGLAINIQNMVSQASGGKAGTFELLQAPLNLARNMIEAQGYDLKSLPKRIESQRSMVSV